MRCPSLAELPAAPPGKTGWPWTEDSLHLDERLPFSCPRITIVTASFNQGPFIEETIRSVLLQGYPDLEYFVLDGDSVDESVEIIKKYSPWISFWASERDGGQSAAINRGLRMGSGLYATWINSDDMLCKNALVNHVLNIGLTNGAVYIGDCVVVDKTSQVMATHRGRVQSFEDLVRLRSVWRSGGYITQPEVLFPLELALRVGGLNEKNHYSMDFELWGRFLLAGARVQYTHIPFGMFRTHDYQKTQDSLKQTESTVNAAKTLIAVADCLSAEVKQEILKDLQDYWDAYPLAHWKQSGRLGKMGFPPWVGIPIRKLGRTVKRVIGNGIRRKNLTRHSSESESAR